jgi:hypothetical protein
MCDEYFRTFWDHLDFNKLISNIKKRDFCNITLMSRD